MTERSLGPAEALFHAAKQARASLFLNEDDLQNLDDALQACDAAMKANPKQGCDFRWSAPREADRRTVADLMMGHAQTHSYAGELLKLWREHGVYRVHLTRPLSGEVLFRDSFTSIHFARRCFDNEKRKMK